MYSDVVFGWVAWIWLSISNFLLSILKFFTIGFKICWGCRPLPGPRGGAEAEESRTQQKVRDTQPNPCYSAKNNVAIRTISTFMSTPLKHRTSYALYDKVRNDVISIYSLQLLLLILIYKNCFLTSVVFFFSFFPKCVRFSRSYFSKHAYYIALLS